eukprot:COSAG05_NODE_1771_length_4112_cov_443.355594_4_plen_244_part_00
MPIAICHLLQYNIVSSPCHWKQGQRLSECAQLNPHAHVQSVRGAQENVDALDGVKTVANQMMCIAAAHTDGGNGRSKPKKVTVQVDERDGDWICACGSQNFETRVDCWGCGEKNPDVDSRHSPIDFADLLASSEAATGAEDETTAQTPGQLTAETPGEPGLRFAPIDDPDGLDPSYYNEQPPAGVEKTSRELLKEHRTKMLVQQVGIGFRPLPSALLLAVGCCCCRRCCRCRHRCHRVCMDCH